MYFGDYLDFLFRFNFRFGCFIFVVQKCLLHGFVGIYNLCKDSHDCMRLEMRKKFKYSKLSFRIFGCFREATVQIRQHSIAYQEHWMRPTWKFNNENDGICLAAQLKYRIFGWFASDAVTILRRLIDIQMIINWTFVTFAMQHRANENATKTPPTKQQYASI